MYSPVNRNTAAKKSAAKSHRSPRSTEPRRATRTVYGILRKLKVNVNVDKLRSQAFDFGGFFFDDSCLFAAVILNLLF
jgi:hypothetical protein